MKNVLNQIDALKRRKGVTEGDYGVALPLATQAGIWFTNGAGSVSQTSMLAPSGQGAKNRRKYPRWTTSPVTALFNLQVIKPLEGCDLSLHLDRGATTTRCIAAFAAAHRQPTQQGRRCTKPLKMKY
jgi:hypothetical protein